MRSHTRLIAAAATAAIPLMMVAGVAKASTTVVALWHMENASVMTDSSGNGNDGTTTAVGTVPGYQGNGYAFNGSTSGVSVPDAPSLDPGSSDFSYTAHVNFTQPPNSTVGDYDLIRKGLAGTIGGDWKMEIDPPSVGSPLAQAFCVIQDANKAQVSIRNTRNLADGQWHTITCAKTSTTVQVIVDGVATIKSASLGSINNNKPIEVGQKLGGGDQYLGTMDEVSLQFGDIPNNVPPSVTATSPAANATAVPATTAVTATFSEPVQGVSGSTFTLAPTSSGTPVAANVSYDSTSNTATLQPNAALADGTQYTATLTGGTTGIQDTSGNPLPTTTWSFTTAAGASDGTAPQVKTRTPAAGAVGVGPASNVTATFTEPVQGVDATTFTLVNAATGTPIAAAVTQSTTTNKWILNPNANLPADTQYTATLTGGASAIRDLAGNPLATTSWTFQTGPAPTITFKSPASGATGISVTAPVNTTFSEPVQNVSGSTYYLKDSTGTLVPATVAQSGTTNKWVLTPSSPLAHGATYTVTVVGGSGGVTDLVGNPLASTTTWSFTTS